MKEFSVTILGSSAALPYKGRNLTSQLVNYGGSLFLIDCGEGTQMQLMKYRIRFMRINHIFISHLHGDHFYGLIGLVSTFHLLGRREPLHIYGPAMLEEIIRLQLQASLTNLVYPISFHVVNHSAPVQLFEDERIVIGGFPMQHRIPTTGFLFAEKAFPRKINLEATETYGVPYTFFADLKGGADYVTDKGETIANEVLTIDPGQPRSFASCSDTGFFEALPGYINGCDLMYHEATFMNDLAAVAREKMHSTAGDAAKVAELAKAGRLLIGHFSARYENLGQLLDEARRIFPATELAEEGKTYTLQGKR